MVRPPQGAQGEYEPVQQDNTDSEDTVHEVASKEIKPKTYYEDGPFDASSSESDDDVEVYGDKDIQNPGNGVEQEGLLPRHRLDLESPKSKPNKALRFLLYALAALTLIAGSVAFLSAQTDLTHSHSHSNTVGTKKITMDHVFNGTFGEERRVLRWVPEAGDGVFSIEEDGYIKLVDLKTNTTKNLVRKREITDGLHQQLTWDEWTVSSDMDFILIKSDSHKQWRWSSHATYFVHQFSINFTRAVAPARTPPVMSTAILSPSSPPTVLFVENNDLYMLKLPALRDPPTRITHDGSATVFNGVPDWVYEEEIFSGDKASWWSPDGRRIAFLRFDETNVNEYSFPVYNLGWFGEDFEPYTPLMTMKYPKPGYPNPLVTLHVYDIDHEYQAPVELTWEGRLPLNDSIITEVTWISPTKLLIKEVNRGATKGQVVVFDVERVQADQLYGGFNARGKIVRRLGKDGEHGDDGWIDQYQYIRPLKSGGYLDVIPTPEGYDHIAYFPTAETTSPTWVTRGEWEVAGPIDGVDEEKGIVYFTAANPSSIERHIFSAALPKASSAIPGGGKGSPIAALTNTTHKGWHGASFSAQTGFYVLRYDGPDVPTQRVLSIQNTSFEYVLTENHPLKELVSEYMRPSVTYGTLMSDGYELNTVELRPPNFDSSGRTKYPVLFRVYGGPHSQLVDTRFSIGWHDYLASSLRYIIVQVDGRGTSTKGRKLRNPVKGQLGKYEVIDQINAAKEWAGRVYVDKERIGVWGWSYGGYMASKIVEANAGVHKLAISVAPVTDWRMYDSIYTERYMGTPDSNPDGYNTSAVLDVTGFNAIDFALAHGSGDDNVHFANSAHLLDLFTTHRVRNFRFRMFTDSDHSISRRGAYRELHEWLTGFLLEKWGPGVAAGAGMAVARQ